MIFLMWSLFLKFRALKASAGIPFSPGALLFFRSRIALLISTSDIWSSRLSIGSLWRMKLSAVGEVPLLVLLKMFLQCCPMTDMFSLSFFALEPFGRRSAMLCGLVWFTAFPLAASRTAFQASLESSPVVVPILSAMCRM